MDDGAWLYYKLTNEPKGSGELKTGTVPMVVVSDTVLSSFKVTGLLVLKKIFAIFYHIQAWSCNLEYLNNFRSPHPMVAPYESFEERKI